MIFSQKNKLSVVGVVERIDVKANRPTCSPEHLTQGDVTQGDMTQGDRPRVSYLRIIDEEYDMALSKVETVYDNSPQV